MFVEEDSDVFFDDNTPNESNVFGELNNDPYKSARQVGNTRTGEGTGKSNEGRVRTNEGLGKSSEGRGYTERSLEGRNMNASVEKSKIAPSVKGVYPVKSGGDVKHSHPAYSGGNNIVENKKTYVGSLGKISDEGCVQHGDMRFVSAPVAPSAKVVRNKMREYVIAKEILGKPKCKK